jgi:O-methyltransferase involved in polyketide biosynthesis
VALDFNRQLLEDIITASEFDKTCRTFFLWEGVTNYLSAAAVEATFRAMRSLAQDSLVLFTYVHKAVLDVDDRFAGTTQLNRTLQRAGER